MSAKHTEAERHWEIAKAWTPATIVTGLLTLLHMFGIGWTCAVAFGACAGWTVGHCWMTHRAAKAAIAKATGEA